MADLEDEAGAVPGAGPTDDRRAPAAGGVPAGDVAPGSAQKPALRLDGQARVETPKKAGNVVRPDLPTKEIHENTIVSGEPNAPPLSAREGGLTKIQRAVADYKMRHPDAEHEQVANAVGVNQSTVAKALVNPKVRTYMSPYLDRAGATLEKAAEVVAGAHSAEKETPVTWEGEITDTHKQPDHKVRLEAAKLSMQAHGVLAADGLHIHQELHLTDEQLVLVATGKARMSDFARTRPDE